MSLEESLQRGLFPLNTPIADLPVGGYRPDGPGGLERPRPAAVLVPVTEEDEPRILLTVRAAHLAKHAGQVAFPGGGRDRRGETVVQTALREAHEETGLAPECVRPAGLLGRYDTITGFRMTAVVGRIDPTFDPVPDLNEVAKVFSVRLAHVLDPDAWRRDRVKWQGRCYELLTLDHPEHRIWGATAALLKDLGERLEPADRD